MSTWIRPISLEAIGVRSPELKLKLHCEEAPFTLPVGKPLRCVYQKVREEKKSKAKGFVGRACLAGLLAEFCNICKCRVVEGVDPAKDVGRNKHLLRLVNNRYMCHDAL